MSALSIKKLLDAAFPPGERRVPSPPTADFFVRFSELFERGRTEVQRPASPAGALPQAGVVFQAALLSPDRSAMEPLVVALSQFWPKDQQLDLGLRWDRAKLDPALTPVVASLVRSDTGEVVDVSSVCAFTGEDEFSVSFDLPPDLSAEWKDLTLEKVERISPCRLILQSGRQPLKR